MLSSRWSGPRTEAAAGRRLGRGTNAEELERRKTTCGSTISARRRASLWPARPPKEGGLAERETVRQRGFRDAVSFGVVDSSSLAPSARMEAKMKMRS